jgi:hypothetical protein
VHIKKEIIVKKSSRTNEVQGEGDIEADRHYREATEKFVKSGKVETALKNSDNQALKDSKEPKVADKAGSTRSKGKDRP